MLIENRKNLVVELASITTYNISYLTESTNSYSFNQLQEIKAGILYGLSFDQSLKLVDLISSFNSPDLTVHKILRAISYGH